jgi:hypothetical protein
MSIVHDMQNEVRVEALKQSLILQRRMDRLKAMVDDLPDEKLPQALRVVGKINERSTRVSLAMDFLELAESERKVHTSAEST